MVVLPRCGEDSLRVLCYYEINYLLLFYHLEL